MGAKIGFLRPKESEIDFAFLYESTQDLLDHGASKKPKNPL